MVVWWHGEILSGLKTDESDLGARMSLPNFDLSGKVAVITGASKGIGEAIALTYAAAGAKVVVSSRKQEGVEAVRDKIKAAGGECLAVAAHTGDMAAIAALVQQTVEAFGGIDIAVNNAGINPHYGSILTADDSIWAKTFDVNVIGYMRLIRTVVPLMRARGGGKIINNASIAGIKGSPMLGVYSVTKAGVMMLTELLAGELAPENIQVNAIAPGVIKTKFSAALWDTPQPNTPPQQIGTVNDVTGVALYLASAASDFTTGGTFVIDGGALASQRWG
jgi:NAD(P)-dependent dehydrogenase (short-subunit alcohol dehydrogenase family)